jgi:hypothetical protein
MIRTERKENKEKHTKKRLELEEKQHRVRDVGKKTRVFIAKDTE